MPTRKKPAERGHGGPSDDVVLSRREQSDDSPSAIQSQDFAVGAAGRRHISPHNNGASDPGRNATVLDRPKARPVRLRALEVLERGPATAEQIADEIGTHFTIVRARCSGLRAMGLIADTSVRGRGALGGRSIIWRATTALERVLWGAAEAQGRKSGRLAMGPRIIIAELEHGAGERVKIALDEWRGRPLLDIRLATQLAKSADVWSGTKKGVSVNVALIPALREALEAAEAQASAMGLLNG